MVDPESALAALSTIDFCIKYGKKLVERYQVFKHANQYIGELILCLEHHWIKFEYQVVFLKQVWNTLDGRLQVHQHHLLQILHRKLNEANALLDDALGTPSNIKTINSIMTKKGDVNRAKYAWSLDEALKRSIDDLKEWHDIFDPSWFLISRTSSPKIDVQICERSNKDSGSLSVLKSLREALQANLQEPTETSTTSIWLTPDRTMGQRSQMQYSRIEIAKIKDTSRDVIIDTISLDPQVDIGLTTREVRNLARTLSKSDPALFGLLQCLGVVKKPQPTGSRHLMFELLYAIPNGFCQPTSLRSILLQVTNDHSLNERLDLAKSLASSVMYIHSPKFVHKNIRPETTIIFSNDESQIAAPFLLGFEKFRSADGRTYRIGDLSLEKNLYRHPSRQGLRPEEDYVMQHDIYSLGILLLEIGLWTSFIKYDPNNKPIFIPELNVPETDPWAERNERKRAAAVKTILVNMASTQLASRMGLRYTNVVLTCLTCLDKTNNEFGDEDEFLDQDGIVVGVRYIEKVANTSPDESLSLDLANFILQILMKLHEISI